MELIKTLRGMMLSLPKISGLAWLMLEYLGNNEVFGLGTAGKYLFGGDEYGTISVWDLNTLECTHLLHGHDNRCALLSVFLLHSKTIFFFPLLSMSL